MVLAFVLFASVGAVDSVGVGFGFGFTVSGLFAEVRSGVETATHEVAKDPPTSPPCSPLSGDSAAAVPPNVVVVFCKM